MPRTPVAASAILVLTLLGVSPARAGFVQSPGHLYLKVYNRTVFGAQARTRTGALISVPGGYLDNSVNIHGEYGVLPWLTGLVSARPLGWAAADGRSTAYLGPMSAGLRAGGTLPGWSSWGGSLELSYGYSSALGERNLALGFSGDGIWSFIPQVEAHTGQLLARVGFIPGGGVWAGAGAGFLLRSRGRIGPVFMGDVQLGWHAPFGLEVEIHGTWSQPLRALRYSNVTGAGVSRYVGLGATLGYWVNPGWNFFIGVDGGLGVESNLGAPAWVVGLQHRAWPVDDT